MKILYGLILLFSFSVNAQVSVNLGNKTLSDFFLISSEILEKTIIVDPVIDGNVKVFQVHHSGSYTEVFDLVLKAHNLVYEKHGDIYRVKANVNTFSFFFPFFENVNDVYITSYRLSKKSDDFTSVDVDFKVLVGDDTFYVSDRALSVFDVDVLFIDSCLVKLTKNKQSKYVVCPPFDNSPVASDIVPTVDIVDLKLPSTRD